FSHTTPVIVSSPSHLPIRIIQTKSGALRAKVAEKVIEPIRQQYEGCRINLSRSLVTSLQAAITLLVVCFASTLFAAKENPSGLYVLISGKDSFGQLSDHPAISLPYVDGFRFKQTWGTIETADNVYNWTELDNAVNAAVT